MFVDLWSTYLPGLHFNPPSLVDCLIALERKHESDTALEKIKHTFVVDGKRGKCSFYEAADAADLWNTCCMKRGSQHCQMIDKRFIGNVQLLLLNHGRYENLPLRLGRRVGDNRRIKGDHSA